MVQERLPRHRRRRWSAGRTDQPFLDHGDGEPALAGEDLAAGEATAARRRRGVLRVEQPLVGAERPVEPHGVIEAGEERHQRPDGDTQLDRGHCLLADLHRLVNSRLRGVDLADYLKSERDTYGKSFRQIAIDLITKTGVDVTHEAVRRWYRSITEPRNS